jgi:hypothetical protein
MSAKSLSPGVSLDYKMSSDPYSLLDEVQSIAYDSETRELIVYVLQKLLKTVAENKINIRKPVDVGSDVENLISQYHGRVLSKTQNSLLLGKIMNELLRKLKPGPGITYDNDHHVYRDDNTNANYLSMSLWTPSTVGKTKYNCLNIYLYNKTMSISVGFGNFDLQYMGETGIENLKYPISQIKTFIRKTLEIIVSNVNRAADRTVVML